MRVALADAYDLGQEFFRWEIATAVAGAILGIDAFDQPDVEASKIEAPVDRAIRAHRKLPAQAPFFEGRGLSLYADAANRDVLERAAGDDRTLRGYLRAHFAALAWRLLRAARGSAQPAPREPARRAPARHPRPPARRDLRGVRPTLSALHRSGLQGRSQQRRIPPNHGRRAARHRSPRAPVHIGVVKDAQARGDFEVWRNAAAACSGSTSAATSIAASTRW